MGGFSVNAERAAAIATAEIPLWVTHGVHDHVRRHLAATLSGLLETRGDA